MLDDTWIVLLDETEPDIRNKSSRPTEVNRTEGNPVSPKKEKDTNVDEGKIRMAKKLIERKIESL